jgi:hypothetical protein
LKIVNFIFLFLFIAPTFGNEESSSVDLWKKHSFLMSFGVSGHEGSIKMGTTGVGIEINTEDTLGLDSSQNSFRLGYLWRFSDNRRHSLDFNYYRFHRSASTELLRDITVSKPDGSKVDILKGQRVDSTLNFDIYKFHYDYAFIQDDRLNFSFGGGLYVMPFEIGVQRSGSTDGTSSDFIAPLPTIKLRGEIIVTEKWRIVTRLDALYLKYNSFSGHLLTNSLIIDYLAYKGLSIGLGIESFNFGAEMEKDGDLINSNLSGNVKLNNRSLLLNLRYSL